MDSMLEKSSDGSRALLFGLLANCLFPTSKKENCPLWELRNSLSIEKKHEYAMGLSDEEVKSILAQHECCYESRLSDIKSGNL
jgi:hypothetical protein